VTVSLKWSYVYTAGWRVRAGPPEVKHHDVETLRRQPDETRERLRDWLAVCQVHSATPESGVLDDAAVLADLAATAWPSGSRSAAQAKVRRSPPRLSWVCSTWCRRRGTSHERAAEPELVRTHTRRVRGLRQATCAPPRWRGRRSSTAARGLAENSERAWGRRAALAWG